MLDFKAKLIRLQSQTVNHLPLKEETETEWKGQEIDSEDRSYQEMAVSPTFPIWYLEEQH